MNPVQAECLWKKILFYRATKIQRSRIIIEEGLNVPSCFMSVFTQPSSKLSEGDQVLAFLVQQREGAVRQRVSVLV